MSYLTNQRKFDYQDDGEGFEEFCFLRKRMEEAKGSQGNKELKD